MIYESTERDFLELPLKNCAIRIKALKAAYGLDVPFIRYYADREGRLLALMDGYAILHSSLTLTDEWLAFLHLLPDMHTLYTDGENGKLIVKRFNLTGDFGCVMSLNKPRGGAYHLEPPPLRPLYALLSTVFTQYTPFDGWYVDISHRIRHGCCHVATAMRDGRPVACAMTLAETNDAAILGGVATDPGYRKQGLAQQCIEHLLAALMQKNILISPVDDYAKQYYTRFGFSVCEYRMEIDFTQHNGG